MSEKQKFPAVDAAMVAAQLCALLDPVCERVVIAGSLRRGKELVGDIELLYVPKFQSVSDGLFDSKEINLADAQIERLRKKGVLEQRLSSKGHQTWGSQNKLAVHCESGIPVDFFATDTERWFVALVIRTGPKDFNLRLTTGAQKRNRTLHAYGGIELHFSRDLSVTKYPESEEEVINLCGVPYLPPEKR